MERGIVIKDLRFTYKLHADYSNVVHRHNFAIMFTPMNTHRQKVNDLKITIDQCDHYNETLDYFGNEKIYGSITEPHEKFDVTITGNVRTGLDVYEEFVTDESPYSLLKYQTALTEPGEAIKAWHDQLELDSLDSNYEKTLKIMHAINERFEYTPGATQIHAKAEETFVLGQGVCQDYAHIMLSLLRMEKIPSRYVVGVMEGEGASHAWVEALCRGYWYGFDPTNNHLVDDAYIKVSSGRDSSDCPVIRGTFVGRAAMQTQSESVIVEEIKAYD